MTVAQEHRHRDHADQRRDQADPDDHGQCGDRDHRLDGDEPGRTAVGRGPGPKRPGPRVRSAGPGDFPQRQGADHVGDHECGRGRSSVIPRCLACHRPGCPGPGSYRRVTYAVEDACSSPVVSCQCRQAVVVGAEAGHLVRYRATCCNCRRHARTTSARPTRGSSVAELTYDQPAAVRQRRWPPRGRVGGQDRHGDLEGGQSRGRGCAGRINSTATARPTVSRHGGEHRAVFVYQIESYRFWERALEDAPASPRTVRRELHRSKASPTTRSASATASASARRCSRSPSHA